MKMTLKVAHLFHISLQTTLLTTHTRRAARCNNNHTMAKYNTIILGVFALVLSSCSGSSSTNSAKQESTKADSVITKTETSTAPKADTEQLQKEAEEKAKIEAERKAEEEQQRQEELRQKELAKRGPEWLQGTWHLDLEGPNGISINNYTLVINGNNATYSDDSRTLYRGEFRISDGYLYLGSFKRFQIIESSKRLYYYQYRLTKDGQSGSSLVSSFRTESDVATYLSGRTFYSNSHKMSFTYNSVKIDGYTVAGAPRVRNFSSTSATLEVSPIGGGRPVTLYLNASNGTVNYEGDIFRLRK